MRNCILLGALALLFTLGSLFICHESSAQCATCPTPVAAYSPVVYNTYQVEEGWYPGKLLGRLGQRLFGTAPAPAYPNYTAAYPTTYAASYAPAYATSYAPTYAAAYAPTYAAAYAPAHATVAAPTYATSYAPSSTTCCPQTTYRPVMMQPVVEQPTSYAPGCSTCGAATATVYNAAPAGGCPNCTANYAEQAIHQVPAGSQTTYQAPVGSNAGQATSGVAPPSTFREPERRYEPTPANGTSANEAATNFQPPQLFAPGDKQAKRPSTTVWTAVYEQPTKTARPASQAVSASYVAPATVKTQPNVTWVAVE